MGKTVRRVVRTKERKPIQDKKVDRKRVREELSMLKMK